MKYFTHGALEARLKGGGSLGSWVLEEGVLRSLKRKERNVQCWELSTLRVMHLSRVILTVKPKGPYIVPQQRLPKIPLVATLGIVVKSGYMRN